MSVVGIIAEYNPFHTGHLYHLREAKRLTGADTVIAVMNGDWVQRGAPAIADKFVRAEMALNGGADLVLELPVCAALGSAEFFAWGAVSLLNSLGAVDFLCFGSESGDLAALDRTAGLLAEEPPEYRRALQAFLGAGLSFPAARDAALKKTAGGSSDGEDLLSHPNDILGVEYLKALRLLHSEIQPVTVRRIGSYHEEKTGEPYASASAIRRAMADGVSPSELTAYLPKKTEELLNEKLQFQKAPLLRDYSDVLHYRLLCLKSPRELMEYQDLSKDLANRIFALRGEFSDAEQFIRILKTKQYTYSRIARCLTHLLLELKTEDYAALKAGAGYAKVLGVRKERIGLLSEISRKSAVPLLVRLKDAEKLSEKSKNMLQKDLFASAVYHMKNENARPEAERALLRV